MCTAPEPPLQAGQGMVKWTTLDMVQSRHTCEINWTLGVNRAQAFPLVWVHPKSKWIEDGAPQLKQNSTKMMNDKNIGIISALKGLSI